MNPSKGPLKNISPGANFRNFTVFRCMSRLRCPKITVEEISNKAFEFLIPVYDQSNKPFANWK